MLPVEGSNQGLKRNDVNVVFIFAGNYGDSLERRHRRKQSRGSQWNGKASHRGKQWLTIAVLNCVILICRTDDFELFGGKNGIFVHLWKCIISSFWNAGHSTYDCCNFVRWWRNLLYLRKWISAMALVDGKLKKSPTSRTFDWFKTSNPSEMFT